MQELQETRVQSLGWEDPLEEEMATHSSILAWKIHDKRSLVHIVKVIVFPIVMYGCESWTMNKAEHQRTDGFEMWC